MGVILVRSERGHQRQDAGRVNTMSSPLRLVVCINERLGVGQKSCIRSGNLDYIASIRQLIEDNELNVPIVQRECLGKCEQGPVMRIAPGGRFFTEINQQSLSAIVDELKSIINSEPKT